ncbi:MAG TPA: SulP family inorganic anion transporter [Candidatus Paceibacterota bacterium]
MTTTQLFKRLQENWRAGLSVALISLPLSISLGVASGATPMMGIITAVWAGLMAGFFGGSNYNIVGPAGALSGVLAAFALGAGPALLPMVALFTGLFVLVAYFFKLEQYLVLIPKTIMYGFSLGVGLIIGAGQLQNALQIGSIPKHEEFIQNVIEVFKHVDMTYLPALMITIITTAALFLLVKYVKKVPGVVIVAPIGILLGYLSHMQMIPLDFVTLLDKFGNEPLKLAVFPQFAVSKHIIVTSISVAFIAILETLISAKIGDLATNTKFNSRKELLGLSIANVASGIFGGLPATGVFVRTGLNIKSGATHKTSQVLNAIFVAAIGLLLFKVFIYIPLCVVAGILMYAAIKMVEVHEIKYLYEKSKRDFIIAMGVAVLMFAIDTIVGLMIGVVIALLILVRNMAKAQFEVTTNNEQHTLTCRAYDDAEISHITESDTTVYSFKGSLIYINADEHVERIMSRVPHAKNVVLRLRELALIDLDGLRAFGDIVKQLESQGVHVVCSSAHSSVMAVLAKSEIYEYMKNNNMFFVTTSDALKALGYSQEDLLEGKRTY